MGNKRYQVEGWNNHFLDENKENTQRRYRARGVLKRDVSIQSGPSPDDTGCDKKGTIVKGEVVADKHHRPITFKYFSEKWINITVQ